jgi:hypothetical protein
LLYIDRHCVDRLKKAGFVRPYQEDVPSPYDYYEYNDNEWSLGGQLTGESIILAPQDVYEKGTLLPTITDLMDWLEFEGYTFNIINNGNGYRVIAKNNLGKEFKGKGGTLPYALTSIVELLLLIQK